MVDIHFPVVFQALHSEEKYIRIQDDSLSGDASSVDISSQKNLDELEKIGELLNRPVSMVNMESGVSEPIGQETNREALQRFAKIPSNEKTLRMTRSPLLISLSHNDWFALPWCYFCLLF